MPVGPNGGTVISAETNEEIGYSFRRVSNRKLEQALELLDQAGPAGESLPRKERIRLRDEAFLLLVDGSQVLEEGTFVDIQEVLTAAVRFNQVAPDDSKKSE